MPRALSPDVVLLPRAPSPAVGQERWERVDRIMERGFSAKNVEGKEEVVGWW
jgi:hypothetical protein